jgi:hypothetical protein
VTRIEERLAALLRSAAPTSPGVPFEDVAARVRQRRKVRWSVAGSVVTVAAVAVGVSLAGVSGGGRTSRPATTVSVDLAGSIPWIGAPAQPYRPPTDARPCTANDVAASFADGNGAGGHLVIYVSFRNTSQSTCVLKGYPRVTATEPGLPDVTGTNGSFFPSGDTANMPPGHHTLLGLETDSYCAARPGGGGGGQPYHHIDILLPGGGTVSLDRASNGFDVTCGLHLSTFFVQQPEQPEPHDPLSDLQASLEAPPTVSAGTTLTYLADLSNPTDQPIRLSPCPGYVESATAPTPVKESYALNCAPVGAIAAQHTIRFEIRMHIPTDTPAGPLTIHWRLYAPSVTGSATVNVVTTPTAAQS